MNTEKTKKDNRREVRFYVCLVLGFVLMMCGFFSPPMGEIHNSVLVGAGLLHDVLEDTNATYDEIVEEYLFGIFGEDWKKIYDIFTKIADVFPYDYVCTSSAKRRPNGYLSKEKAESISKMI